MQMVELDVAGVNSRTRLSSIDSIWAGLKASHLLGLLEDSLEEARLLWGVQIQVANEVANGLFHKLLITVSHHVRLVSCVNQNIELLVQGLLLNVGLVTIFHPVDREEVTEAGIDFDSIDDIIGWTVCSPGRLERVSSGDSIDVNVVGEDAVKHGPALASLKVEHKLRIHLILVHHVEGRIEVVSVEILVGERDKARSTVIRKVYKHLALARRLKHSAVATLHLSSITLENG
jgi:hypothetical protein